MDCLSLFSYAKYRKYQNNFINNVFNRIFIQKNILTYVCTWSDCINFTVLHFHNFLSRPKKNLLIMRHKLSVDSFLRFQGYVFFYDVCTHFVALKKLFHCFCPENPNWQFYMCNWVLITIEYHCFSYSLHFQMHMHA